MFQVGQRVMYGFYGVCTIANFESKRVDRKNVTYLVLEPEDHNGSKYFVPVQNPTAMGKLKPMLSAQQMVDLLGSERVHTDAWVNEENQRKQLYRELTASADRESIMRMVYTIYRHKDSQLASGRRCHLCDENFLRDAEKLLIGEIAATLDLSLEQSRALLREKLQGPIEYP